MRKRKKEIRFIIFIFIFLLFSNVLAGIVAFDLSKNKFLEVNYFNVGQGDSIFIETPQKHQILIDGGPSAIILEKLNNEMPFWDRTIDLIILTHPEKDHLVGLIEVLKKYKIENILWTGIKRNTSEFQEWEKLIHQEKANIEIAKAGQKIILGDAFLKIIYPLEDLSGKEFQESNKTSIVNQLFFGENIFLFTGDISKTEEKEILTLYPEISADILKVSHHGSKNSNSEEFIKKLSPQLAIILVGKNNPYNHPHQEVLDIFQKYDIKILRTDHHGDIKITSDGKFFKINNN